MYECARGLGVARAAENIRSLGAKMEAAMAKAESEQK